MRNPKSALLRIRKNFEMQRICKEIRIKSAKFFFADFEFIFFYISLGKFVFVSGQVIHYISRGPVSRKCTKYEKERELSVISFRQNSCNQRVSCLLGSMAMIYGMGFQTSANCVVWSLAVVRMSIELKYRKTPYIKKI